MKFKQLFKKTRQVVYIKYDDNILTILFKNGDLEKYEGNSTIWFKYNSLELINPEYKVWLYNLQAYLFNNNKKEHCFVNSLKLSDRKKFINNET